MSRASDKVIADVNRYIDAMKQQNRMPSAIYLTKQQFTDLKNGLGKANDDNWKPRIRSIPVEIAK